MRINRILRNQEDSSPGSGATVTPAPTPAPAPSGAAATPPVPVDALKEVLGPVLSEFRNGIFADLRKAGAFKPDKPVEHPNPTPTPQQAPGAPNAAAGLSVADVEAMLERERVITARATKYELTDAQIRRMKSALSGVAADQFAIEADAFLNDLGLVRTAAATQQSQPVQPQVTQVAQPSNQHPASDKGSPAPGGVLDWEREFAENPIGMSPAARQRMDAKYGADKARRMRVEAGLARAAQIRVTTK